MQHAVGYVRVSTTEQAEEGLSLDAQRSKIEAWCHVNDMTLRDLYVDAGISGTRADNRPQLQAALDAVTVSQDALVVYSLSRLARSTKDTLMISEQLQKAGADLVSLSEKIDTTSAAGKMVFRMLAVLNEFERDLVSERTTAALAHRKSQGQRTGKIPFGFDLAEDGATLLENPNEQATIVRILRLRDSGSSLRQIACQLNDLGVPTKEGSGSWRHTTVHRILNRKAAT